MVPRFPRGLRHPFPAFSAAPSSAPHAGVLAPATACPFPHPSAHTPGKREGALPTVSPHRWPTSAVRWGRGAWARLVWERGAGARHCAPRSSPPRALPHTHPGAESGQRALSSASISRWSGSFTSGARGSGLRGPPRLPASALPSPEPRPAPAPPAPPSSRSCRELAASPVSLPQRPPSQTQLRCSPELARRRRRRRGAWAGRGESGVRRRDREGWVARSPALLPFCTPCGRQRAAAAAAAGGLVHRDRQT